MITKQDHTEGRIATMIEDQTAKLPSDTFLWAALGSMVISLVFAMSGKRDMGTFIGQWVPTLLIFGLYNKIVKTHGNDRTDW